MSNIEKAQPQSPALTNPDELGLENWETRDLILPQLRIRQPTSDVDDVPEGTFYNVLTHEYYETLYVIFLKSSWGRLYFDREEGVLICKSVDRIQPSPSIENPPASVCAACPYSKWENNEPPKCREVLNNILMAAPDSPETFDIDHFSPYLMTVAGTSLKPMRAFVSALIARKRPIYSVVAKLSLEKKTGNVGKFYVLKISIDRYLSEDDITKVREAISMYAAKTEEVIDASINGEHKDEIDEADVDF